MNEEAMDQSVRKFLKHVGVNSHQLILRALADAEKQGTLAGNEMFPVRMTLEVPALQVTISFDGAIELE